CTTSVLPMTLCPIHCIVQPFSIMLGSMWKGSDVPERLRVRTSPSRPRISSPPECGTSLRTGERAMRGRLRVGVSVMSGLRVTLVVQSLLGHGQFAFCHLLDSDGIALFESLLARRIVVIPDQRSIGRCRSFCSAQAHSVRTRLATAGR